jgi:hypothetical protein
MRCRLFSTSATALLIVAACTSPDRGESDESTDPAGGTPDRQVQPVSIDEAVTWTGTLTLQESDSTLVGNPNLRVDPRGGWLYWDSQLNQARRYSPDGILIQVFGGPGEGPGEFSGIRGLLRLSADRLATVDASGRVAIWTESGELESSVQSGVLTPWGAAVLSNADIALATAPHPSGSNVQGGMLHKLDIRVIIYYRYPTPRNGMVGATQRGPGTGAPL